MGLEALESRTLLANNITIALGGLNVIPIGATTFSDTGDYTLDPSALAGSTTDISLRANETVTWSDATENLPRGLNVDAKGTITVLADISTQIGHSIELRAVAAAESGGTYGEVAIGIQNAEIVSGASLSIEGSWNGGPNVGATGVWMNQALLGSSGTGVLRIIGTGGTNSATAGSNEGVFLINTQLYGMGGPLAIAGSGGYGSGGIETLDTQIYAGGAGTISISGTGDSVLAADQDDCFGVSLASSTVNTFAGDLTIHGQGGGAGNSSGNTGVSLINVAVNTGGSGKTSIDGTGGSPTGGSGGNRGVDSYANLLSQGGPVEITGRGGATGSWNHGVRMWGSGYVHTLGTGPISIVGVAGTGSGASIGLEMSNGASILPGGGPVSLDGSTRVGSGGGSLGVFLHEGAAIVANNSERDSLSISADTFFASEGFTLLFGAGSVSISVAQASSYQAGGGISAGELTKAGLGDLSLLNISNAIGRLIHVTDGTLTLAGNLLNSAGVDLEDGTVLDTSGFAATFTSLAGAGDLIIGLNSVTIQQDIDTVFSGELTSNGGVSFIKEGVGTLEVGGNNRFFGGAFVVNGGTLFLNQSGSSSQFGAVPATVNTGGTLCLGPQTYAGQVTLAGGRLVGSNPGGVIFGVDSTAPSTVSPGASPGLLSVTSLALRSGDTAEFELGAATSGGRQPVPGADYDQLRVVADHGFVTLGDSMDGYPELDVSSWGYGFPEAGSIFTLIDNRTANHVEGLFQESGFPLTEGASVLVDGYAFRLSYLGGDGNDVTLTFIGSTLVRLATIETATPGFSVFGEGVTFAARVSGFKGQAAPGFVGPLNGGVTVDSQIVPTGLVTFRLNDPNGPILGASTLDSTGIAVLRTNTLPAGTLSIFASYSGSSSYDPSASSILQTVDKAQVFPRFDQYYLATTYGQPIALGLALPPAAPGLPLPSGFVTFVVQEDPTLSWTAPLVEGRAALPAGIVLPPGRYTFRAEYFGDDDYQDSQLQPTVVGSVGDVKPLSPVEGPVLDVTAADSLTEVNYSYGPGPLTFGEPITFDVRVLPVSPAAGTPDGSVALFDGPMQIRGPVELVAGRARFEGVVLAPGTVHNLRVAFTPGLSPVNPAGVLDFEPLTPTPNFKASSATFTLVEDRALPGLLVSGPSTMTFGLPARRVVDVQGKAGATPTGYVSLLVDGILKGRALLVPVAGSTDMARATIDLIDLPAGSSYNISAIYEGDSVFQARTAGSAAMQVNPDGTTVQLLMPPIGQVGTLMPITAVILPATPGAPVPTGGTLEFFQDGVSMGVFDLDGGNSATMSVMPTGIGGTTFSAVYSPRAGGNYAGSASSPATLDIAANPAYPVETSLSVAISTTYLPPPSPVPYSLSGRNTRVTYAVQVTSPVAVPTGTVTVLLNGVARGTYALDAQGRVSITLRGEDVFKKSLVIRFNGTTEGMTTFTPSQSPTFVADRAFFFKNRPQNRQSSARGLKSVKQTTQHPAPRSQPRGPHAAKFLRANTH